MSPGSMSGESIPCRGKSMCRETEMRNVNTAQGIVSNVIWLVYKSMDVTVGKTGANETEESFECQAEESHWTFGVLRARGV